jgi:hypothetical protein
VNCFGFVDSGEIDLSEPGKHVYFLGRNSFGKTSVLRAISYLEYGLIPSEHPSFANYEPPSEDTAFIRGTYSVDASGGEGLSATALVDEVIKRFSDTKLEINRDNEKLVVTPSQWETAKSVAALLGHVYEVYSNHIERIRAGGEVAVGKLGNGEYQFYPKGDSFTDYKARRSSINRQINNVQMAFRNEGKPLPKGLAFNFIEGLLFTQFPDIFVFTDRFSLDENLPRSLREEHLGGRQNALTEAFIEILGRDEVAALLRASSMGRITESAE